MPSSSVVRESPFPALTRAQGVALHRQLYLVLRDHIKRGVWPAGSALPTEEKLCAQFAVSRITVRRALADLQAQGLAERRPGVGTFVRGDPAAAASAAAPTLNFVDTLRMHAETTQVRVIEVLRAVPPPDIAASLQLAPGELALHAVRLRLIDEVPVMMTDAWVPDRLGRKITAAALKKHALYEVLMAQGVQFGRVVQEITAVAADPRPAMHLGIEPGVPLLKLVRLLHDLESRPVQHLVAVMPPERGRVLMDIKGDQVNTLSAGYIVHSK
jgi:GntR family transcriptional regulator